MIIKTVVTGALAENCHLVWCEKSRMLYVIDPGADPDVIISEAKKNAFDRAEILLTHGHIDHISAAACVAAALGVKVVRIAAADRFLLGNPVNSIYPEYPAAEDLPPAADFETDGDYRVLDLPGHSPGGSGFLFEEAGKRALFTGDTIFSGSIGRSDLWGGDGETLLSSIREKILTLEDALELYPGHGPATTVGEERKTNPWLQ